MHISVKILGWMIVLSGISVNLLFVIAVNYDLNLSYGKYLFVAIFSVIYGLISILYGMGSLYIHEHFWRKLFALAGILLSLSAFEFSILTLMSIETVIKGVS